MSLASAVRRCPSPAPWFGALLLAALASGCAEFPAPGGPGYFVVDSTADLADASPGDGRCRTSRGTCTLRAAIMESNVLPGASTVRLPAGIYTLTLRGTGEALGDLDVRDGVQILGAGASTTIIDGNGEVQNDRIFELTRERLHIVDVTLRNGGNPDFGDAGGIIVRAGNLLLRRVVMTNNQAFSTAGALYNAGLASIEDCTFDSNLVVSRGGAIINNATGIMGVERTTFSNNSATLGGAMINAGTITMWNSTVSGNQGTGGTGGLLNAGGSMTLNNVTVTNNTSREEGFGIAGGIANSSGTLELSNTIVAGNLNPVGGAVDCSGTLLSRGYNLLQQRGTDCTVTGDLSGVIGGDPLLAPLANNGGATRTHLLGVRSPARDAGNPAAPGSTSVACRPADQRGVARPVGARCDMGATEQ
jgi:CSLREA domain-containing protein